VAHFVNRSREQPTEVIRILNKDVLPYWGHRDARTICAREVIERLDAIVARGAPVMANRTADILGQMFNYGIHRAIVSNSPVQLLFKPGGKERTGKRAFSDKEIIAFLHGLPAVCTAPQKLHIMRLLLLTLQRRSALALAEWHEVDFEECVWRIPAKHDKERRAHILPLTDWAVSEFKALKMLFKDSRFVVPNNKGDKAANPQLITRSVTRLQDRFQAIGIEPFNTHDLRRTGRTHMSKLGVQKHISERVLNHSMGEVEGTYDLYEYTKEKRDALKRWEKQ
jgi:integrase